MPDVNFAAILTAAALSLVLGGVWYGPLFGRAHAALAGISGATPPSSPALRYGAAFCLALLASATFAPFIGASGPVQATLYGLCAGFAWVSGSFAMNYLFEQRPLRLWLINGGYHTLQFTLIGFVLGAWK